MDACRGTGRPAAARLLRIHMELGTLRQRDRPLTPDLWPLTRLSDGLSIPSGLVAVIVAWSSLDLCLEQGTAGLPAAPEGLTSSPVTTWQQGTSPEQRH